MIDYSIVNRFLNVSELQLSTHLSFCSTYCSFSIHRRTSLRYWIMAYLRKHTVTLLLCLSLLKLVLCLQSSTLHVRGFEVSWRGSRWDDFSDVNILELSYLINNFTATLRKLYFKNYILFLFNICMCSPLTST